MQGKSFWSQTSDAVTRLLDTTLRGLDDAKAAARLKKFGLNRLGNTRQFGRTKIFLRQFKSPLIFILIIAGAAVFVFGEWADAIFIFLAVSVNVALGFYQENRAENSLEKLRSYIKERVRVIRNGREQEIDAELIVPGDIIHLSYGVRVPADARLITIQDLSVDESILTGESLPVTKTTDPLSENSLLPERTNMVFGGTLIIEGYATAIVTTTGRATEIGKIAELVAKARQGKTPLQQAVEKLAWLLTIGMAILIIGLFAVGISRGEPVFEMFLISAAVAVGAIPEALPIALTVVLAVGVERLAKRKGIMRNLAAAETLGSTSIIITDKTGTLTEARINLVNIIRYEELLKEQIVTPKKITSLSAEQKNLLYLATMNTDVLVENPQDAPNLWRMAGKPLETHIVQAAALHGLNPLANSLSNRRLIIPFNSARKFSVSLALLPKGLTIPGIKSKHCYVILGAPDILLAKSKLDKKTYQSVMAHIETLSNEGQRLLGVAVLTTTKKYKAAEQLRPEAVTGITFLGILSFFDPVRAGVPATVKNIEASGVRVIMATGDLKGTALAVATQLGWHVQENEIITGEELQQMSDKQLGQRIDHIKVYARVTPEDKMRVGLLLKRHGEVVGMTGDGVNDAPSLKAVDIGIAVGSGSDVAKDVADLVLLDDNFETIVSAIEEGRRILSNIKKAFIYLISNSLDEVILIGGALLVGLPLPLSALQIIWVNFFTESLPALSYAFDTVNDHRSPHESKKIFDSQVKVLSLGIGIFTSVLLFALYWFLLTIGIDITLARTFLFACFASYVLFVAFSLRSLKTPIFSYNIFSNRLLTVSVLAGLGLIVATIYVPFLQEVFDTTSLGPVWLLWLALWTALNIGLVESVKWAYRKA